jgi:hypothetical protein
MKSVYDELSAKAIESSLRGARDGAKRDLGIVLYAERDALRELWKAADASAPPPGATDRSRLRAAVESLRPLFGERA